tara:strand:- start:1533 stop:1733 length:201 start_codon:yes stop_codon:yes gene_type:complete
MNLNHFEEIEETYFKHFFRALMMSFNLLIMAIVCLFHALLPFIFTSYVSKNIREINSSLDQFKNNE